MKILKIIALIDIVVSKQYRFIAKMDSQKVTGGDSFSAKMI